MGLVDKIRLATTVAVVENLLAEGNKYPDASPKTRRRWRSVATRRLKELQPRPEKKTESPSQETPDTESGKVVNRHRKYHKA